MGVIRTLQDRGKLKDCAGLQLFIACTVRLLRSFVSEALPVGSHGIYVMNISICYHYLTEAL